MHHMLIMTRSILAATTYHIAVLVDSNIAIQVTIMWIYPHPILACTQRTRNIKATKALHLGYRPVLLKISNQNVPKNESLTKPHATAALR